MRLDRIDATILRRLVAGLTDRGLSRNTIRLAMCPVKLVFAQAVEDGLIDRDPSAGIRIRGARAKQPPGGAGSDPYPADPRCSARSPTLVTGC